MTSPPSPHAQVVVDLGAIRHNVRRLRELVTEDGSTGPQLMVVVKADGYGHGMLPVARAARAAGAEWLGVSTGDEALVLRRAGDTGRLLCWLAAPGADYRDLIESDVDVTTYSVRQLEEIVDSARQAGRVARVQLKFDTGLSRGGAPALGVAGAGAGGAHRRAGGQRFGSPGSGRTSPAPTSRSTRRTPRSRLPSTRRWRWPTDAGLDPEVRHLANSGGAILHPGTRHDLVRLGIAVYGLSPAPDVRSSEELGLVPAMTVSGSVVLTKELRGRRGRLLRAHLRDERADAGGPRPDGVRRRHPAACLLDRRGPGRGRARPRARPDLHGPVRRRGTARAGRRRGRAVRAR